VSSRLTCFISSTVKDFASIRRDLRDWMEAQGIVVRPSDHDDFPVEAAVTSHEACLRAIEQSHLVVLLIGERYGGKYGGTTQSITWREYDEARRLRIPVIALVLRHVNESAERWAKEKKGSRRRRSGPSDEMLAVFDFINAVRKGHTDNWMHLWDGSLSHASQILRARFNALFVSYQVPHNDLVRRAEALGRYAEARRRLDVTTSAVISNRLAGGINNDVLDDVEFILSLVETDREVLFGFREGDRYNFAVYSHRKGKLHPLARRADKRIRRRNRTWKLGEGHVGLCFQQQQTLVSPDLKHTKSWVVGARSDRVNYVSAIAVPLNSVRTTRTVGVLVITSDRKDHFVDPAQAEVLTAEGLALTLGLVGESWP
jgi:hypothetical protein